MKTITLTKDILFLEPDEDSILKITGMEDGSLVLTPSNEQWDAIMAARKLAIEHNSVLVTQLDLRSPEVTTTGWKALHDNKEPKRSWDCIEYIVEVTQTRVHLQFSSFWETSAPTPIRLLYVFDITDQIDKAYASEKEATTRRTINGNDELIKFIESTRNQPVELPKAPNPHKYPTVYMWDSGTEELGYVRDQPATWVPTKEEDASDGWH